MKKYIYTFVSTVLMTVLFIGCSSDNELYGGVTGMEEEGPVEAVEPFNVPEKYQVIGEMHNQGLEAGFAAIRAHYAEQASTRTAENDSVLKLSKEECLEIAYAGLTDFASKNIEGYSEFVSQMSPEGTLQTRAASESSMSPQVAKYVERIEDVLADEPENDESLIRELNAINDDAAKELSETDLIAVYAGTSTCYNSYLYWKENHKKWILMLNRPELLAEFTDEQLNSFIVKNGELVPPVQTKGWLDDAWSSVSETWDSATDYVSDWWNNGGGKEVVAADAGSAVEGAIEGALIGGAASGGSGTGLGAIVGGIGIGAAASIDSAVQEWILHNL